MTTIAFVSAAEYDAKNAKQLENTPLHTCLNSLQQSASVSHIVLAADSKPLKKAVESFKFLKISFYSPSAQAKKQSNSESLLLNYLKQAKLDKKNLILLVDPKKYVLSADDIDAVLEKFKKNKSAESLVSVTLKNGLLMNDGTLSISSVKHLQKTKSFFSKSTALYELPKNSFSEINSTKIQKKSFNNIKLFLSDVDGVLTDAGMYYSENGDELKKFNTYDGMGFKLIQKMGVKVGILTAENRKLNRARALKLKLDYDFHGIENKLAELNKLLKKLKLSYENVAYVGDDINDIEVLKKVGFAFCPSSSQPEVLSIENIHVLSKSGGQGAVREIYNLISK